MDSGKWPEFVHFREELVAAGAKPADANRDALAKFLGGPAQTAVGEEMAARHGPNIGPVVAANLDRLAKPPSLPSPSSCVVPVTMADFAGKQAGTAECIRWVARHMDIVDVLPADCPDPMAWSMLQECRRAPLFRFEFYKSILPKTIERGDTGDRGEGDEEVARQVEVIERLLAARDAAKKPAEVAA